MFWTVTRPTIGREQPEGHEAGQQRVLGRLAKVDRLGFDPGSCHTFSTSGFPKMPCGRKISVIARMEKAATSL